MKEMLKALCDMNTALYEAGCIRAGGDKKEIHLDNKAFRSLFKEWHTEDFGDDYDKCSVTEDGYVFFTLVKF